MNVDIEAKLILDLDALVDLATDELVVLLRGDLALGELVTLDTDLLGLLLSLATIRIRFVLLQLT